MSRESVVVRVKRIIIFDISGRKGCQKPQGSYREPLALHFNLLNEEWGFISSLFRT